MNTPLEEPKITLSPSQEEAKKAFFDFLNSERNEFVLAGFAGSGKSFLVKHLIDVSVAWEQARNLIDDKAPPILRYYTATTNKAAMVLSKVTGRPCTTVHSALNIRVKNNYKTGEVELDSTRMVGFLQDTLLFIDEASMINKQLLALIRSVIDETTKIVYIGDPYQLAPVKQTVSPVFHTIGEVSFLKEVQRQLKDSNIIKASQEYRRIMDDTVCPKEWPNLDDFKNDVAVLSDQDFKTKIEECFSQPYALDTFKILAWQNATVIQYNEFVRALYTTNPEYQIDEYVVSNNHLLLPGGTIWKSAESTCRITSITPHKSQEKVEGFQVILDSQFSGFMPKHFTDRRVLMKHFAKHQDWKSYFRIKDYYLDLRPAHASTVHKSQGSTYKTVFVDFNDLNKNTKWHEIARLAYVAITRASQQVYIRGELTRGT